MNNTKYLHQGEDEEEEGGKESNWNDWDKLHEDGYRRDLLSDTPLSVPGAEASSSGTSTCRIDLISLPVRN